MRIANNARWVGLYSHYNYNTRQVIHLSLTLHAYSVSMHCKVACTVYASIKFLTDTYNNRYIHTTVHEARHFTHLYNVILTCFLKNLARFKSLPAFKSNRVQTDGPKKFMHAKDLK